MEEKIKLFSGHSGSVVHLCRNRSGKLFVRKEKNVSRNFERLTFLKNYVNVPEIYDYDAEREILNMEYIHGQDMRLYLLTHGNPNRLTDFLVNVFAVFSKEKVLKDYGATYSEMLDWMHSENHKFPFRPEQLIDRLPAKLPQTIYHGDFTLENILYVQDMNDFVLIDPVTVKYDSVVFDLAKIRQDLDCKWFLRNRTAFLDVKLQKIKNDLFDATNIVSNDYLLILMLLRVYRHCVIGSMEYNWVLTEVNRLWKK